MSKTRPEIFNENIPDISDADIIEAARANKAVMSFDTLPWADDGEHVTFLAAKLVFADGSIQTILFDRWACSLLCGAASVLEKGQWLIHQSTPPGQTRQ